MNMQPHEPPNELISDLPTQVVLRRQELEAVYAISQAVARATDTDSALDEIVQLARPVFIFDNIVLYEWKNEESLEPTYASAIGRGRSREADLAWGEPIAVEAYQNGRTVMQVEKVGEVISDRTNIRHMLGMPMVLGDDRVGALVFIRFGGPEYIPDHIHLAEFISAHVAQLLGRQQLVDRIASLEAQRRLEGLQDDFISMISHELITPLGFIKGYATTLLREDTTWDDDTRREFLSIIDEESDRLKELIGNLMDSSRLQADNLPMIYQTARLDNLLRDVALRVKSMYEDLDVSLEIEAPGLQIQADPTRLAQVFENIIINAIKYAPGSPVTIRLTIDEDRACTRLSDKGPGISAEHLDKIFQRFYRVPQHSGAARGSGLGLYICSKIIQAHGGEIKAESVLGEGTSFLICLPIEQ
jgi:signal transduction histidine kinase